MEAKCAFTDKELESRGVIPSNGEFTENPFSNEEFTDAFNSAASAGASMVAIILGLVFGL